MNHLTNLYKHKCEQLQEQINNMKRMLNEVNSAGMVDIPSPFQSPIPLNNPTGIDPGMFDPSIRPQRPQIKPRGLQPGWLPNWKTSTPGSFHFDSDGNTWQFLDGRWEVIRVVPGSGLWVGYPDAPGRLIPATRDFPRWFDDDFFD
jgi:hypothetical protein